MKIHEYQAKEILREYGISVPAGEVATTPEEAELVAQKLGVPVMVKAQILAGGRGRTGGVKEAANTIEAREIAEKLLGKRLVTPQTSAEGMLVTKILIQKKLDIKKEFYLGITIDKEKGCPVIISSPTGGMAIEEIAKKYPEELLKEYISPIVGPLEFQKKKLVLKLRANWFNTPALLDIVSKLYRIFEEKECLLAEINPLILSKDNQLYALDAKIVFDDNALFRHPENKKLADFSMEDPLELAARGAGISYVRLNGNIGCLVNGAGLAMATMDAIKLFGGEPANFLDVGGGANPERIKTALQILISHPSVRIVFVNIFGGMLRCDFLAQALLTVYEEKKFDLPLVIRLEGTNAGQAWKIIKESSLKFFKVPSLNRGAKMAVKLAKEESHDFS